MTRLTRWLAQRSALLAALLFLTGALLTILLARWHQESNARLAETAFLRQSDRLTQVLRQHIQSYERGLRGLRGIFVVDPALNRQTFDAYVASRDLSKEFPGVTGMGFVRLVPHHELEGFVRQRRTELNPGFSIRRENSNPGTAMVIDYFAPAAENHRLIGFDIGSQAELREAAMRAMWTGDLALSAPIDLGHGVELAFLLPVYRPGAAIASAQQRSDAIDGWALITIQASTLFSGLLDDRMETRIFDMVVDQPPRLIFDSLRTLAPANDSPGIDQIHSRSDLQRSTELVFGQRAWHLVTSPLPDFWIQLALTPPALTVASGLFCSLLAALLAHFLLTTRKRALRLAEQMTERLRVNQARLHDFSLSTSDWFWETDAEHRFCYFSANYEKLFFVDRKAVLGMTRKELLQQHGRIDPQLLAEHLACIDAHQPFRRLEYQLIAKGGEMRWFSVSGVPYFDAQGRFAGYRGVGEDATARKQAEAALLQARDEAEAANAAKSLFLSRMSHELRTPLNAILGFGQLLDLDKASLSESHADNVKEILLAGEHLLALVNEVLDLSRIESGRFDLRFETVTLEPLIHACVNQLRPLAAERGITLSAPAALATQVEADTTRLKQILLNLLSNAIKYNHPGGSVRIAALPCGEHVRIDVSDTGCGIASEHLSRLFKPFERVNTQQHVEGTGIGLALVKKLVERMGGEVGVHSKAGRGSTFWFSLYLAGKRPLPAAASEPGEESTQG